MGGRPWNSLPQPFSPAHGNRWSTPGLADCSQPFAPSQSHRTRDGPEPSPLYTEAADLIADRYADSPDIGHFCEGLGFLSHGSQPWAPRFERHLRAILKANRDRAVRCRAQFALASVVQNAPEDRQAEAETLFEQYCAEFDGKHVYPFQGIEKMLNNLAQTQLKELRFRAVGRPVPDINGVDLDGRPLRLSDYRGRVVLLNFWATWCFPCMKLIPHERELVARFQGEPFDIVGVNCDSDVGKARDAVARTGMTWRSFRDHTEERRAAITSDWKVIGYPTIVFDRSSRNHPQAMDRRPAARGTHAHGRSAHRRGPAKYRPGSDAHGRGGPAGFPAPRKAILDPPPADSSSTPNTGFLDKVFREADGSEAKYVVFVPR